MDSITVDEDYYVASRVCVSGGWDGGLSDCLLGML